jgi:hypothetical protein
MAEQYQLTHEQLWRALDRLAAEAGLSPSGLARRAGLDPTTFNRSKRVGKTRAERWPSTESIAKVLACLEVTFAEFASLVGRTEDEVRALQTSLVRRFTATPGGAGRYRSVPVISQSSCGSAAARQMHSGAWLDLDGLLGERFFAVPMEKLTDLLPLRGAGHFVVSLDVGYTVGDLVAIGLTDGRMLAGTLTLETETSFTLEGAAPEPACTIPRGDVEWVGRIVLTRH